MRRYPLAAWIAMLPMLALVGHSHLFAPACVSDCDHGCGGSPVGRASVQAHCSVCDALQGLHSTPDQAFQLIACESLVGPADTARPTACSIAQPVHHSPRAPPA